MLASPNSMEGLLDVFAGSDSFVRTSPGSPHHAHYSDILARCENLCGLSLSVIDPLEGRFVSGIAKSLAGQMVIDLPKLSSRKQAFVCETAWEDLWAYGMHIPGTPLIAGGLLLRDHRQIPQALLTSVKDSGLPEAIFSLWAERHSGIRPEMGTRLLQSAHDLILLERDRSRDEHNTSSLSIHLGQVYEEVILIQDLAQYLRPDVDPPVLTQAVMDRVREISETNLSAVCIRHGQQPHLQSHGPWGLDVLEIETLVEEILGDRNPQVVVRNHIDTSPLRLRFPGINSLVAVPLFESDERPSWLVLANPRDEREMGTEEANLLRSIGGVLAAHAQVVELFRSHEEMVLAFIRSLVTTLDAKDSYTRGHSERVALVGERIAQEMNLSLEETQSIYQSGLLHDIGKIGVDDALLRKQEALNSLEFRKIAQHPEVGYSILSELTNLSHLLPGVLHHHERFDGRGYPSKLAGNAIPRMARILSVADAFDAMGSDRPYRKGKCREDVERILRDGAGTQWDPEVIEAFFKARLDIYRLWARAIERQDREGLRTHLHD